jgi:hypothetical protein
MGEPECEGSRAETPYSDNAECHECGARVFTMAYDHPRNGRSYMLAAHPPRRKIIATALRTIYVAPTSGRPRLTKPAAYREEARARFAATCDCAEHNEGCRYHDAARWKADPGGYSVNGRIVARWACLLAARDGVRLKPPPPKWKPIAPSNDGLPF